MWILITLAICFGIFGITCFVACFQSMMFDRVTQNIWEEYEITHPPISDAEFLDQLSSSVRPDVALRVRRLVAEVYGIEYERIYPETNLVKLDCV